ncbi:MAG: hypothetical protein ACRC0X_09085 [Brevinema sp.]
MKYLLLLIMILLSIRAAEPEARYDIGQDLIKIDTSPECLVFINSMGTPYYQSLYGIGASSNVSIYTRDDYTPYYRAIYQDQKTKELYLATMKLTNNISYTINSNLMEEPRFHPQQRERYLLYVGSISPLERIYYRSTEQQSEKQLYIKTLVPFKDAYYLEAVTENTNVLMFPVFPSFMKNSSETYYTNQQGDCFIRFSSCYTPPGSTILHNFAPY